MPESNLRFRFEADWNWEDEAALDADRRRWAAESAAFFEVLEASGEFIESSGSDADVEETWLIDPENFERVLEALCAWQPTQLGLADWDCIEVPAACLDLAQRAATHLEAIAKRSSDFAARCGALTIVHFGQQEWARPYRKPDQEIERAESLRDWAAE